MFVLSVGRCLSGRELLLAQGFPATDLAAASLDLQMRPLLPDKLSNHAAVRLAGNGMHSNCMGLALCWALFHHLVPLVDVSPPGSSCKARVAFEPGFASVVRPVEATTFGNHFLFLRELRRFVNESFIPVAVTYRSTPLLVTSRQRDLLPLPDLPIDLEDDPPEVGRITARLCACGLNVLWGGGAITPLSNASPTRAQ